jgi:transposase
MNNLPLFVGLDYHANSLQLCVLDAVGKVRLNRAVPNDVDGVVALLRQQRAPVQSVAIEACCGAAAFGEALAERGDWRVELAHPGYVARLKQSPDKTDFSDARLLGDLTRVGYLPRVWLPPQEVRDLRQLVNHRVRLVERRRATKLQIGAVLREQRIAIDGVSRWSKAWLLKLRDNQSLREQVRWVMNEHLDELEHVSRQIAGVEARLREATMDDPVVAKLRTIEGVGEVTAWMLRAWVGRFDRFKTGKQLSRYCGLSPRNASSGQRQADAGLIDAANKPLRAVLVQAAHRLMRLHERWGKLAESMLKRGKAKPLVVAAIANRWVRSMHHRMTGKVDAATASTGANANANANQEVAIG